MILNGSGVAELALLVRGKVWSRKTMSKFSAGRWKMTKATYTPINLSFSFNCGRPPTLWCVWNGLKRAWVGIRMSQACQDWKFALSQSRCKAREEYNH